jgi:hypothetical protein
MSRVAVVTFIGMPVAGVDDRTREINTPPPRLELGSSLRLMDLVYWDIVRRKVQTPILLGR